MNQYDPDAIKRMISEGRARQLDRAVDQIEELTAERDGLREQLAALLDQQELIGIEHAAERDRLRAVVEAVPGVVEKVMRQVRADRGSPLAGDPDTIRDHVRAALDQLDASGVMGGDLDHETEDLFAVKVIAVEGGQAVEVQEGLAATFATVRKWLAAAQAMTVERVAADQLDGTGITGLGSEAEIQDAADWAVGDGAYRPVPDESSAGGAGSAFPDPPPTTGAPGVAPPGAPPMCSSGDHGDVPAVGDALTDETEEEPNDTRYPYCGECLDTLGSDYEARRWWQEERGGDHTDNENRERNTWRSYQCHHCHADMRACLQAPQPCCAGCHHGGSIRHHTFSAGNASTPRGSTFFEQTIAAHNDEHTDP